MPEVTVTLADDLLRAIDAEIRRRSTSRSAFLAEAATRELARRNREQMTEAIARSVERFRGAGAFDSAALVRHDRDTRS